MVFLSQGDFYRTEHRDIYERMSELSHETPGEHRPLVAERGHEAEADSCAVATVHDPRRMSTPFVDKRIEPAGGARV
jgi:hypothetical protein